MISQLLLTKFQRNSAALSTFLFFNALYLLLICYINRGNAELEGLYKSYLFFSLFLYFFIGSFVFINDNREKRIRLFAQLPVTSDQISCANWSFILISLCGSTLFWCLSLLYIGGFSLSNYLLYVLLYFSQFGTFIAISFVGTQHLNLFSKICSRKITALTPIVFSVLAIFGLFFILLGDFFILDKTRVNWILLMVVSMTPFIYFITLDIYLYKRVDNYLGKRSQ